MSQQRGALALKKQKSASLPGHALAWVFMSLGGLVLAGCGDAQVVAEVGKSEVRRADVELFRQDWSARERPAPAEALQAVVDRTLLAEAARREGLAEDEQVRARVAAAEREVLARALLEKRLAEATGEGELRKRYEAGKAALARAQVNVRHILVRLPGEADAQGRARARSRINELYARLRGGEDFEKVAREASEDRVSGEKGGALGVVEEGQVDASFFKEAAALKKGEVSRPFETSYGLHLVQAVEDVQVVTPGFDEVKGRLAAEARREAEGRVLAELRESIRAKTYPERLRAADAKGRAPGADAGEGR
ncbi:MAG TPA: peptidylprolyl isomerase [Archangium sp.]|nr:peptidylprolyl isomerase [Archangium sp.]